MSRLEIGKQVPLILNQEHVLKLILSVLCLCAAATAGDPQFTPYKTTTPPVIDGKLDDAVWQSAVPTGTFDSFVPDFGKPMPQQTEAYMAYDANHLYFAFRCYDSEPKLIKASLSKRDKQFADDWVCINLDSFNDQQSLYSLYINPLGVQGDTRFANNNEDPGFDMVWYSAGKIDEQGYVVEVRLPLKSIRFAGKERVEMGVIFERRISRLSMQGTWPPLNPEQGMSFVTQTHPLILENLHQERLLELLPAVTYNHQQSRQDGKLQDDRKEEDLSLTAKVGITSQLVLDGTYNPDFNQVESDAGQVDVNLRSALFFEERRPFFQEGAESFTVANINIDNPVHRVVHTRNIVDPIYGLKLNGKLSKRDTIASLVARDEVNEDNPADYAIFRYKRRLHSDSFLGGIYTSREDDGRRSRLLGVDGNIRTSEAAILNFQALTNRDEVDGGEEQTGHTIGTAWRDSNRQRDYYVGALEVSEDFDAAAGFVTRTGIRRFDAQYQRRWYPENAKIPRLQGEFYSGQTEDLFSDQWETNNHAALLAHIGGAMVARVKYTYATEVFNGEKLDKDGWSVFLTDRPHKTFSYDVTYAKRKAIFYAHDPYQGRENLITADITWQPSDTFNLEVSHIYLDFYRESTDQRVYDIGISRGKFTYQPNRYLFFRAIAEYNDLRDDILTDVLASFTYIPGTVMHVGYGSLYRKRYDLEGPGSAANDFLEAQRGFFFKASYNWRK